MLTGNWLMNADFKNRTEKGGGGGGLLNSVLYGGDTPRGTKPYHFNLPFWLKSLTIPLFVLSVLPNSF